MNIFTRFGEFLLMLKGMFTKPEQYRVYWKELMHQCVELGIGSLGIVSIISVFIGAVSTVQTAYQFVSPIIPRSVIAQINSAAQNCGGRQSVDIVVTSRACTATCSGRRGQRGRLSIGCCTADGELGRASCRERVLYTV